MSSINDTPYRTIPIDFDVHKALTARLQCASDTDNDVLRRLLGLNSEMDSPINSASQPTVLEGRDAAAADQSAAWVWAEGQRKALRTQDEAMGRSTTAGSGAEAESSVGATANGRPWVTKGVVFPHGTQFRRSYKGRLYAAHVDDGALVAGGQTYDSASAAAMAITGNSVNGWIWWECRLPGHARWLRMDNIR